VRVYPREVDLAVIKNQSLSERYQGILESPQGELFRDGHDLGIPLPISSVATIPGSA